MRPLSILLLFLFPLSAFAQTTNFEVRGLATIGAWSPTFAHQTTEMTNGIRGIGKLGVVLRQTRVLRARTATFFGPKPLPDLRSPEHYYGVQSTIQALFTTSVIDLGIGVGGQFDSLRNHPRPAFTLSLIGTPRDGMGNGAFEGTLTVNTKALDITFGLTFQ